MSKVEIVLDKAGVNQLRKCEEIEAALTQVAEDIVARCSGNYEIAAPFKGQWGSNVEITTADNETYYRNNLHNNELLKALK